MKKSAFTFFIFVFLTFSPLYAEKVLIFTYSFNRPDFIEMQYQTFKKFLQDDYEYIVFNDAVNESIHAQIEATCAGLNIRCINIPQEIHSLPYLPRLPRDSFNHPSIRNCNVVQYSLNSLGLFHNGIVALFDSDLFLVKEFSITKFMQNHQLAGLAQSRKRKNNTLINYIWIGLVFLDMSKLPNKQSINFNTGRIDDEPVDAGGYTYFYLQNSPEVEVRYFSYAIAPLYMCKKCVQAHNDYCTHNTADLIANGFDENQMKFARSGPLNCEFFERATFVHYRAGTNWDNKADNYHEVKTKLFNKYFQDILE